MPNFHDSKQALNQARDNREKLRQRWFLAKERKRRVEARITRLKRSFSPNDPALALQMQKLDKEQKDLEKDLEKLSGAYANASLSDRQAVLDFAAFSDPRVQIEELDDSIPILLMPLRIETRFKALKDGNDTFHQLWVRVFPDDWAVDNFEEDLSETELKNARLYWANHWKAGGFEEEQRAAWRGLVANHGTGRSAYIISQYFPNNQGSEPPKTARQDVLLVVITENMPSLSIQEMVAAFWSDIWKSGTDPTQLDLIWNALVGKVGAVQAEKIRNETVPVNLEDEPLAPYTRAEVNISLAWMEVPGIENWKAKTTSWTQPARAQVLPDRFVLRLVSGGLVREIPGEPIRTPLVMGPDPSAEPADLLQKDQGEIKVPEELRWMVNFDEAVTAGMGFRVSLSDTEAARGFDKLMVLGVRLSSDATESQLLLENLIDHHHYSLTDFSLLPQGTPTNNTEDLDSAYSYRDDAEQSFERYVLEQDQFAETDDWTAKQDGQWLAEWLGIRPDVMQRVAFSGSKDQCESRAMHTALWPATLGYSMESLMGDVFGPRTRELTRTFFTRMVVPRGIIPSIRIGEQPYGIMPATAWSRMDWISSTTGGVSSHSHASNVSPFGGFVNALYQLLLKIDTDWAEMLKEVSFVGKSAGNPDAHQMLLDIVGLHPSSVEYYQRYAQSVEQVFNQFSLLGLGGKFIAWLITGSYIKGGMDLLQELGAKVGEPPEILTKLFLQSENLLQGPIIDDTNIFSETQPIRNYTTGGENYLQWLIDAASTSLDTLRTQAGFTDNKRPRALLYHMLRHALQLSYWESSLRLLSEMDNPILSPQELQLARQEAKFIHVQGANQQSESKFHHLYQTAPALTNDNHLTVGEYIPQVLKTAVATQYLSEQIEALKHLKDAPTARLERVFAEHIDTCTYRLDAWKQSLINYQLTRMRFANDPTTGKPQTRQGIYLGAYGYLEEVRSENKVLTEVNLNADLQAHFQSPGESPLLSDEQNQGYIHAPSLNHAVTAAILRNGYLSNADKDHPDALAVNLSSERVRLAMGIMEGIRNGQSLGAMLGYQLERDLHDNHELAETDAFILDLRKAFSLVANRLKATRLNATEMAQNSIEAIEARNVVDGVKMAEFIAANGNASYPFGRTDLPAADQTQKDKINAAVDRMLNIKDAVADLAIAESVHQTVLGNYDRAAANLDAYSRGALPPIPHVVQTPRSGLTLTHRVALRLDPNAGGLPSPWTGVPLTPRALAEPAINHWLAGILPAPNDLVVKVHRSDTDSLLSPSINVRNLKMQPIDLLFALRMEGEQAMQDLDDRILQEALSRVGSVRADVELSIRYTELESGKITLFELAPLIHRLRETLLTSRVMKATDLALHNEAKDEQDATASLDRSLIGDALLALQNQLPGLDGYIGLLGALLDDPVTNRAAILSGIDAHLTDYLDLAALDIPYGMSEASRAFGYDWKKTFFNKLDARIQARIDEWTQRAADFELLLIDDLAATTDEERFAILQKAELLIRTTVTTPLPANPTDFRNQLLSHRSLFSNKRQELVNLLSLNTHSVFALLAALVGVQPFSQFDWEEFSLDDEERSILTFSDELLSRAKTLRAAIDKKINAADAALTAHDATASVVEKVDHLQQGGKAIFGEDFQMVPRFTLNEEQGIELENAYAGRAGLLNHQQNNLSVMFPVDEWLYGIGRVREKMHHWEQLTLLAEGFGSNDLDLEPLQIPFQSGDSWLALEYPPDYEINSDRLLLTWMSTQAFVRTQAQCGLLIDEWTEVIPTKEETTGVTFHYDRPNSEPPQVMLLVTPTRFQQSWEWQDVVDAVEESFDMAKKRAIAPEQINQSSYPHFLPATVSAVTMHPITIAMNLAMVNGLEDVINND